MSVKNIALDVFAFMSVYNKPRCLIFEHVYNQVNAVPENFHGKFSTFKIPIMLQL